MRGKGGRGLSFRHYRRALFLPSFKQIFFSRCFFLCRMPLGPFPEFFSGWGGGGDSFGFFLTFTSFTEEWVCETPPHCQARSEGKRKEQDSHFGTTFYYHNPQFPH